MVDTGARFTSLPAKLARNVDIRADRCGGITAANTPDTPDVLLDGAIAAAIKGLINGVQEVKAIKEDIHVQ